MKRLQTLFLLLIILTLFGCEDFRQSAKIGEPFKLKMNESAKVGGAGIEITVIRIGRQWLANGGGESLDFGFSVKHGGKTEIYSESSPAPITAGNYKIEIVETDPFGGYATFIVTKNDAVKNNAATKNEPKKDSTEEVAAKFVESFGWHIDETITPTKVPIEFPKNFNDLPFYHYQSVSERSGVDMTSLLGKTTEMLKYTLKEKLADGGADYLIFAHLIIENGKVVGAWRTDSSDSTPGIYSFEKK